MDEREKNERIERRRQVVAAVRAMATDDAEAHTLVTALAADADMTRVIGVFAVAGATMARTLAQASGRTVDAVLDELEERLTAAPVE